MQMVYRSMVKNNQNGVSLLEVLIALVIFGVAMLGTAGMIGASVRDNNSAYLKTQAAFLAHNMAERMRANRPGVLAGHYDAIALGSTGGTAAVCDWNNPCRANAVDDNGTPLDTSDDFLTNAPEPDMANNDEFQWKSMIANNLPGGQGSVTRVAATVPPTFRILVQWNEGDGNTNSANVSSRVDSQAFAMEFHP